MAQKPFEEIRIDLRPFGWGIRDVGVIWPDDHKELGPDTVGTVELKDSGVEMEDLSPNVTETMACLGDVVGTV